jgi:hypothetical protein
VRLIASRVRPGARFVHVPPALGIWAGRLIGLALGDVVLTRAELAGLMDELLTSQQAPNGTTRFPDWLAAHRDEVGTHYTSELAGTSADAGWERTTASPCRNRPPLDDGIPCR